MKIMTICTMQKCDDTQCKIHSSNEFGLVLKSSVTGKTYELWVSETTCHALGISFQDLKDIVKEVGDLQIKKDLG